MKKHRYFLGLSLIGTITLGGCGNAVDLGDENSWLADEYLESWQTENLDEAKEILNSLSVDCSGIGTCHSSVGLLAVASEGGVTKCTAWLAAPDLLVTSSLCLVKVMNKGQSNDLSDIAKVLFPETAGYPQEELKLGQILEHSKYRGIVAKYQRNPNEVPQDYAFVRLTQKSKRRPIKISRKGLKHEEKATLHKIHAVDRDYSVAMESIECPVIRNSLLMPSFSATSTFMPFIDCLSRKGDAGAPVLGKDGTARGLLQSRTYLFEEFTAEKPDTYHKPDQSVLSVGTSFSCIESKFISGHTSNSCESELVIFGSPSESYKERLELFNEAILTNKAKKYLNSYKEGLREGFHRDTHLWAFEWEWEAKLMWHSLSEQNLHERENADELAEIQYVANPLCIKGPPANWLISSQENRWSAHRSNLVMTLSYPTIKFPVSMNREYRLEIPDEGNHSSSYETTLAFSPHDISEAWIKREKSNYLFIDWNGTTFNLPFCRSKKK